ncbi:transcriptional regulator, MerR family [Halothece sp. PCC 7418]|uniref:heavy metal-responsive transcriptional regulator n=1 Tax=Halothece sp. (strain PCC 7418) TaxID=65093 RepID=UPI0002A076E8|nr:heavy metal-responsive transcriptional regulator [Halothece sp. PCC 7418]AFZ44709.1 transcriptional regulator, MerR family [Halothece sp. PCC 7418]
MGLKISEVSHQLGVNPQTLYFYERIGLIPSPQRTKSGFRLYNEEDIERLSFILRVKSLGLTLEEIKEILALKEGESLTCQAVYERLQQKITEIDRKINRYSQLRAELVPLLKHCEAYLDQDRECIALDDFSETP